ncbi:hypothetical protein [Proteiniphilum sp. UBA5510]|jgi:hypothetical protein|uniref:hypothetical protein n=1 Tax=Proteiniphilum sp. UBA5510 TaxID=1947286 RepID=UPI00257E94EF|nr:hypothetical protein [Proteiniphilum sp. UBA5510]
MNEKALMYQSMIDELDRENEARLNGQPIQNGTRREVYEQVSKRMLDQKAYQDERAKLVSLREDAIGISPAVAKFLNPEVTPTKFDVDAGTVEIDTSLSPLGGRVI